MSVVQPAPSGREPKIAATMPAEIAPPFDALIRRFERRARMRQGEAYGILFVMLCLLTAAAWVFIQAKEITTRETGVDLRPKLSELQAKLEANGKRIVAARAVILGDVSSLVAIFTPKLPTPNEKVEMNISIQVVKEKMLRSMGDILTEIKANLQDGIKYIRLIFISPLGQTTFFTTTEHLDTIKPDYKTIDFSQQLDRLQDLDYSLKIDSTAITELERMVNQSEVQKAIGQQTNETKNAELSLPFLLQLNITRFGTLTLVGIAIGILVPLYRYSTRLAAFYTARADAIRLQQLAYKQTGFVRLAAAVTPQFDFGKGQTSPDHLIEAARLLRREEKDGS